MYVKQNQKQSKNVSEYPLFCVQWLLTTVMNDLSFRLVVLFRSPGSIPMRFLRKNCGDSRISYVKIADENWDFFRHSTGMLGVVLGLVLRRPLERRVLGVAFFFGEKERYVKNDEKMVKIWWWKEQNCVKTRRNHTHPVKCPYLWCIPTESRLVTITSNLAI